MESFVGAPVREPNVAAGQERILPQHLASCSPSANAYCADSAGQAPQCATRANKPCLLLCQKATLRTHSSRPCTHSDRPRGAAQLKANQRLVSRRASPPPAAIRIPGFRSRWRTIQGSRPTYRKRGWQRPGEAMLSRVCPNKVNASDTTRTGVPKSTTESSEKRQQVPSWSPVAKPVTCRRQLRPTLTLAS